MDDSAEDTVVARSDLRLTLAGLPLFADLDPAAIAAIASEVEWLSLPGSATLFEAGEPADAMYILLSGCLGAFAAKSSDRRRFLGRISSGESVGEMGLITGRARTAHVVALRDSELVRLSREAFDRVMRVRPDVMMRIARLTVERLESSNVRNRGRAQGPRTFTLLPHGPGIDVMRFATELVASLARLGRAELVRSDLAAAHTSHWFHRIESANEYVVYMADPGVTAWTRLCVRQADTLVLIARADVEPSPWPALAGQREAGLTAKRAELVLMHEERICRGAATRWRELHPGVPHHHVLSLADVPRVARLLTGTAVGLVLSGGGARGFAHLGVIKALREAGVPVDLVGGSSMGGIIGAALAAGLTLEDMLERFHKSFVRSNPLRDYTLPIVSLVSGRKVTELLRRQFGDLTIEDLRLPFFCVSANLTAGRTAVHRSGEVWRWLRASVAIPGVLPPVVHGGEVFVDGGAINNLPVDVMRDLGRGPIIGCDVGGDRAFTAESDHMDVPPIWKWTEWMRGHWHRPNIFQILWRAGMVNSAFTSQTLREQTDLLLQPTLAQVDMLNWQAFDEVIRAGHAHTLERLAALPPDAAARLGFVRSRASTDEPPAAAPDLARA
jgi:NTE family protein